MIPLSVSRLSGAGEATERVRSYPPSFEWIHWLPGGPYVVILVYREVVGDRGSGEETRGRRAEEIPS
jgi:hypothetical protein